MFLTKIFLFRYTCINRFTHVYASNGTSMQCPDPEDIIHLMTALGEPARLRILFLLGEKGTLNVGDIAGFFTMSRPAISHHLKVLKDAGVLRSEKSGQEVYYHLDRDHVVAALRELADAVALCKEE